MDMRVDTLDGDSERIADDLKSTPIGRKRAICKTDGGTAFVSGNLLAIRAGATRLLDQSFQLWKTLRNKRTISANAWSVASGSKRGPSSRVKACSAGYRSVL